MTATFSELAARLAVFQWLDDLQVRFGDVLPKSELEKGVPFASATAGVVRLMGPEGIFKPKDFQLPLSITTSPRSPYADKLTPGGLLQYKYRGTDPNHPDNIGLRECALRKVPLVYFHGVYPGRYVPAYPVFIEGEDRSRLEFLVAVESKQPALAQPVLDAEAPILRRYATVQVWQRIHQRAFRERVVAAYRSQCAMCRLRHTELLDAAHIVPDSAEGEPRISNGLSLCKLHHAAFDSFLVSVTPDYSIKVKPSILEEEDGPMLEHGLKGLHRRVIQLPTRALERPDRDALAVHLARFMSAA